jgi:hypothetical protein
MRDEIPPWNGVPAALLICATTRDAMRSCNGGNGANGASEEKSNAAYADETTKVWREETP